MTLRTTHLLVAAALSLFAVASVADEPARAVKPAVAATPILVPARPYWPELTAAQRTALAPLSEDWERLDLQTKKKWVEIANRYPKMQPDEQARTHDRMREWALLTPDQRRIARDSFARIRAMPPEQRAEMLRKYQELPDDRKQALANEGRSAKPLVVPKPLTPSAIPRRTQIREGAKAANPALAAQKSKNAAMPAPVPTPAPLTPAVAPAPTPPAIVPVPAS